jgi:hypothetical protein
MTLQEIKNKIEKLQAKKQEAVKVLSAVRNLKNCQVLIKRFGERNYAMDISAFFTDEVIAKRLEELAGELDNLSQKEIRDFEARFVDN